MRGTIASQQWLLPAVLLLGCAAPPPGEVAPIPEPRALALESQAAARGLLLDLPPRPPQIGSFGGSVVAEDLDGDGDIDISVVDLWEGVTVFANDGFGVFDALVVHPTRGTHTRLSTISHSAIQVRGDRLPDLVMTGWNRVLVMENLGDLRFGPLQVLAAPLTPHPQSVFSTVAAGDPDGDGDLDLFLPGMTGMAGLESATHDHPGAWDVLLFNDEGTFSAPLQIGDPEQPSQSFAALWSDRDLDGDLDLLASSVSDGYRAQPTTWWMNEGLDGDRPRFIPQEMDMAGFASPMGIARADLDGDGSPDYCLADMGPVPCFSHSGGDWLELGVGRGLRPSDVEHTIGWSLDLEDLDNDGALDAVMSAGHSAASYHATEQGLTDHPDYILEHPDVLWRGALEDGLRFTDVTAAFGFGDLADHYGAAVADFDGDGALDIVQVGNEDPAALWMNGDPQRPWLEVELEGPDGNPQGLGALVSILSDRGAQEREISGLRGYGQGPSRAHFGLGEDEVVHRVEVLWPGGALSVLEDVTARQVVTISVP